MRAMDDLRLGAVCRVLRRRLGWRQSDLAAKLGCHQTTISRIERGQLGGIDVDLLRRVFAVLGARFEPDVLWRGGERDRLLDERHAELVEMAAADYLVAGWRTVPEVTFSHFGERGSIDLFCGHDATRTVAVNEMKTSIPSVEETHRRHDAKVRLAARLAEERFGWRPRAVGRILVVAEDRTIRRVIASHPTLFDAAYAARTREIREWIRAPSGSLAGIWFLPLKRDVHTGRGRRGATRIDHARGPRPVSATMREIHA